MAEFNPAPESVLPPAYTSTPRPLRTGDHGAIGTLFSGVADALQSGVRNADRETQANIEKQIFDEVVDIQEEFGVGSATTMQRDAAEGVTPREITRSMNHIQGLQNAFEQGQLRESHYWARLNSMTRQMRSRYPGYRVEIDRMVSGITGRRPANALRSALMNEFEEDARRRSAEASDYERFANQNLDKLPTDFFLRQEAGNPYTYNELRRHVHLEESEEAATAERRAEMAFQKEQNNLNVEQATRQFRGEANAVVQKALRSTQTAIGQQYSEIQQDLARLRNQVSAGVSVDETEALQIRAQMGELRQMLTQNILNLANNPWVEGGSFDDSYAAVLPREDLNAAIGFALQPLDILEEAIINNNTGVVSAIAGWNEATTSSRQRTILENDNTLQAIADLQAIGGQRLVDEFLVMNPEAQDALSYSFTNSNGIGMLRGDRTLNDAVTFAEDNDLPSVVNSEAERWVQTVNAISSGDMNMPLEFQQNYVRGMFNNPSVMNRFDRQSQFSLFNKIASPTVTKGMMNLRNEGDQESWDTYEVFVEEVFQSLFQQEMDSLQEFSVSPSWIGRVVWDTKNSRFRIQDPLPSTPLALGLDARDLRSTQQAMERINSGIRNIAPIIEDAGGETGPELFILLEQMGFDPAAPKDRSWGEFFMHTLSEAMNRSTDG